MSLAERLFEAEGNCEREDLYGEARNLGASQMLAFNNGQTPLWLETFVGGQIYRVGRSREYTRFSLAQMLIAKRNYWQQKLDKGGKVEVHKPNSNGAWPEYMNIGVTRDDIVLSIGLLEIQIAGALGVLGGSDRDSYLASLVLEKALAGETFIKPSKLQESRFSANGNGYLE